MSVYMDVNSFSSADSQMEDTREKRMSVHLY